jgi:hypothetical protein
MRPLLASVALLCVASCASTSNGTSNTAALPDGGGTVPDGGGTVPVGGAGTPLGTVYYFYLGPSGDVHFAFLNSGSWLSGEIAGTGNTSSPAVTRNPAGVVYVAVTDDSGNLLVSRSATAGFPAWSNLGGSAATLKTGAHFDLPGVGLNADGRVEFFIVGTDGKVHHASEMTANSGQFGPWAILDDISSPAWAAHPVAANNLDGTLGLFEVGSDSIVYYKSQNAPSSADWSSGLSWSAILTPNAPSGVVLPGTLGVGTNSDGRLEFFVESTNPGSNIFQMSHQWQLSPGGLWSGWDGMQLTAVTPGRPALTLDAFNSDNLLYIFVLNGGALFFKNQAISNGAWSDWSSLGGTWTSGPVVVNTDAVYIFESNGAGGSYAKSTLNQPDGGAGPLGLGWPTGWQPLN